MIEKLPGGSFSDCGPQIGPRYEGVVQVGRQFASQREELVGIAVKHNSQLPEEFFRWRSAGPRFCLANERRSDLNGLRYVPLT